MCVYFDVEELNMTDMRLHLEDLDYDASRCNAGYTVGGIFYVTVGNTAFPCDEWYDIVFTDLKTWIPRIISFGSNHTDTCLLPFMDGSCQIRLFRDSDGQILVSCIRDHHAEIQNLPIDFLTFLKSVSKCAREYDRILYINGSTSLFRNEIAGLKALLSACAV